MTVDEVIRLIRAERRRRLREFLAAVRFRALSQRESAAAGRSVVEADALDWAKESAGTRPESAGESGQGDGTEVAGGYDPQAYRRWLEEADLP